MKSNVLAKSVRDSMYGFEVPDAEEHVLIDLYIRSNDLISDLEALCLDIEEFNHQVFLKIKEFHS